MDDLYHRKLRTCILCFECIFASHVLGLKKLNPFCCSSSRIWFFFFLCVVMLDTIFCVVHHMCQFFRRWFRYFKSESCLISVNYIEYSWSLQVLVVGEPILLFILSLKKCAAIIWHNSCVVHIPVWENIILDRMFGWWCHLIVWIASIYWILKKKKLESFCITN